MFHVLLRMHWRLYFRQVFGLELKCWIRWMHTSGGRMQEHPQGELFKKQSCWSLSRATASIKSACPSFETLNLINQSRWCQGKSLYHNLRDVWLIDRAKWKTLFKNSSPPRNVTYPDRRKGTAVCHFAGGQVQPSLVPDSWLLPHLQGCVCTPASTSQYQTMFAQRWNWPLKDYWHVFSLRRWASWCSTWTRTQKYCMLSIFLSPRITCCFPFEMHSRTC